MSMFATPPDSYWEPPEASPEAMYEQAEWDADSLVSEWSHQGEYEVWIAPAIHPRSLEPYFVLQRVAHDGDVLYDGQPGEEFDTIEDLRAHMERLYPLLPQS